MSEVMMGVVFVLGPPGSGKGYHSSHISELYGWTHISAGDLLRKEMRDDLSQYKETISAIMNSGKLIPSEITAQLLLNEMRNSGAKNFLIDGFPRNQENVDAYETLISPHCHLEFVLNFECPTEVLLDRVLSRNDDRDDDNEHVFRKRINQFNTETIPLLQYYESLNKLINIDTNRDTSIVSDELSQLFSDN